MSVTPPPGRVSPALSPAPPEEPGRKGNGRVALVRAAGALGCLVFFLSVYSPVLVASYGFVDDYAALYAKLTGRFAEYAAKMVLGGRPLFGVLDSLGFGYVRDTADLRWLRALSIAGIAVVAVLVFCLATRARLPRWLAIALALLVGLMPAFQVLASWAMAYPFTWAVSLAIFAYLQIDDGQHSFPRTVRIAVSFLLLLASLALYQPAAMMFWSCAGLSWLSAPGPVRFRHLSCTVLIMVSALIADFGLAKILPSILHIDSAWFHRTGLVSDIPGKLRWFVTTPLTDSLNLAFVLPNRTRALAVATFIAGGLFLSGRDDWKSRAARLGLAAVLLPLSYLPSLVVAMNGPAYRTQIALTTLILFYAAIALVAWLKWARLRNFAPIVATAAVVGSAVMAATNVATEFARPQTLEYQRVAAELARNQRILAAHELCIVPSTSRDTLAPFVRYDEFGKPSTNDAWAARGLAWSILHRQGSEAADHLRTARLNNDQTQPPKCTVLDFGVVLRQSELKP